MQNICDENKRLSNIANHGVDFRDLADLEWRRALILRDQRRDYGETRLIAMAALRARVHVVVFVERNALVASFRRVKPIAARSPSMKNKLVRPKVEEDRRIARAIALDPDAAPDLSKPVVGVVPRPGRPPKANAKVSVTLRLDQDVLERFRATGQGWQTRINAALRRSKVGYVDARPLTRSPAPRSPTARTRPPRGSYGGTSPHARRGRRRR
jgi:uncharacterized protein (DUF4415 family)